MQAGLTTRRLLFRDIFVQQGPLRSLAPILTLWSRWPERSATREAAASSTARAGGKASEHFAFFSTMGAVQRPITRHNTGW
jgi:hypothetical protein